MNKSLESVIFYPFEDRSWVTAAAGGIMEMADKHKDDWTEENQEYWFKRLVQEVDELGSALAGDYPDPPEWKLLQIASICHNWLEHFYLEPWRLRYRAGLSQAKGENASS